MICQTIPLTSLLIKPAGPDCNLACKYCFYLEKAEMFRESKTHRMSEKILKETLRQAFESCDRSLTLSWQGGEPSLMGLDFYEKVIEYEKDFGRGKGVTNAFQTNGTLLDDNWATFFKNYNFLVGLSIDGPQHIHDHYRTSRQGKGSWKQVQGNMKKLLKTGVAVNAMSCLSSYSAQYPDEMYQFLKENGLPYMQFIPLAEAGEDGEMTSFSVTADAYGDFMCRIFDLWLADFRDGQPTTSIRLFETLFFSCLGQSSPQCTFQQQCGQYLVVEHNGDVFPCDFYVTKKWKLGNVMSGDLSAMLNSAKQAEFRAQKTASAPCKRCTYKRFCHGGCTKDRAFTNSGILSNSSKEDEQLNVFCDAYKKIFAHALPILQNLARQWNPRK